MEWPEGATNAEILTLVDQVQWNVFTDGSVRRGGSLDGTIVPNGVVVVEGNDAFAQTTSNVLPTDLLLLTGDSMILQCGGERMCN